MRVSRVTLRNFKRFTDMQIEGMPATARVVMVTGPNGSGKSAIVEAFNFMRRSNGGFGLNDDSRYYNKVTSTGTPEPSRTIDIAFHDAVLNGQDWKSAVYIRSAHRHQADFDANSLNRMQSHADDPGLSRLVEVEQKVLSNYQRVVSRTVLDVYATANDDVPAKELRDRIIGRVRNMMRTVFGDLTLESPGDPLADGTFLFTKGTAKAFRYSNLSAGEKAAFDLILDFVLASESITNAVYWLDEPELHLSSRVQAKILDAFMNELPQDCQLWVATHSLGMMRYARDRYFAHHDVVFLDTSDRDLDEPVVLTPTEPDRKFWKRVLEIALDDMAALVAPECVYLCEGADADHGFDAVCYRTIFGGSHPEAEFVSVGDSKTVQKGGVGVADAIGVVAEGTSVLKVVDGDDHTEQERAAALAEGTFVLGRRSLETYLLSDEILLRLCESVGKAERHSDLISRRDQAVSAAGAQPDDFKKARQTVHQFARSELHVPNVGQTAPAFLQSVLAPLVTPDTQTYAELHSVLFLAVPPEGATGPSSAEFAPDRPSQ